MHLRWLYFYGSDWDGVNEYEQLRAQMAADELGYVAFAADIFGAEYHFVEDIDLRRELSGLYRSNATLFASRIQAAVDLVKGFDEVDPDNVGLVGYVSGICWQITVGSLLSF